MTQHHFVKKKACAFIKFQEGVTVLSIQQLQIICTQAAYVALLLLSNFSHFWPFQSPIGASLLLIRLFKSTKVWKDLVRNFQGIILFVTKKKKLNPKKEKKIKGRKKLFIFSSSLRRINEGIDTSSLILLSHSPWQFSIH